MQLDTTHSHTFPCPCYYIQISENPKSKVCFCNHCGGCPYQHCSVGRRTDQHCPWGKCDYTSPQEISRFSLKKFIKSGVFCGIYQTFTSRLRWNIRALGPCSKLSGWPKARLPTWLAKPKIVFSVTGSRILYRWGTKENSMHFECLRWTLERGDFV